MQVIFIETMQELMFVLLLQPLRLLYLYGPSINGVGFWEGLPIADICSRLTHVDATFWLQQPDNLTQCTELIDRKIYAMFTLIWVVGYVLLLYKFGLWMCSFIAMCCYKFSNRMYLLFFCKQSCPATPTVIIDKHGNK